MEMPKPTEADKDAFRALVPERPDVVIKPMFGNLGAYVNGNMFMGLFGASIGLKLPADDREKLLAVEGAGPFGPAERPMGGYVSLPETWRTPTNETTEWVMRSLDHAAALPPKEPKRRAVTGAIPCGPDRLSSNAIASSPRRAGGQADVDSGNDVGWDGLSWPGPTPPLTQRAERRAHGA